MIFFSHVEGCLGIATIKASVNLIGQLGWMDADEQEL
jgi:hypothetical protein